MRTPFDLTGQRILVTGAAGGIGAATAELCGRLGAALVLTDIADLQPLTARLAALGISAATASCDVRNRSEVEAAVRDAGKIDAAVLNAGFNPFDDWMAADWEASFANTLAVNVLGPINFARSLLPQMLERGSGRLVLLGSVAGWVGGTMDTVGPHYAAAKGGVHTLVRWLARRGAAHGVLVNGVAPGPVETGMVSGQNLGFAAGLPLRRIARPEEIAAPIAFLCSPGASYVSGTIMDVNGAAYLR